MIRSSDPDIIRPYLEDASNLAGGYASEVVFPENEKEVSEILAEASSKKIPVTVAGNGTGLTGARIPFGGIVLSTEKLGGVQEIDTTKRCAVVRTGTTLRELQEAVSEKGLLYPPDPTEQNAFIGASVSTNASGSRSLKYGSTRRWVRRLRVVLADGTVLDLARGQKRKKGTVPVFWGLSPFLGFVPTYRTPPLKNAAGYYMDDRMDPLDLFIGAEGTLGVVIEVEVALIPKPEKLFSGVVFFPKEEYAWQWVDQARREQSGARALEYLDSQSITLLKEKNPQIPDRGQAAILFEQEIEGVSEDKVIERWLGLSQKHNTLIDQSWFATTPGEQQEFRQFRYAIPVAVNELLHQYHQTKVGTDFSVPNLYYFDMLKNYHQTMRDSELTYCIFGHIGGKPS
jgi:D-lactate dehydrogenase (cytochrome)